MSVIRLNTTTHIPRIQAAYLAGRLSAQSSNPQCLHRNGSTPCAIGVCIPDKDYEPSMEGHCFGELDIECDDKERFARIQLWHDTWCSARESMTGMTIHPLDLGKDISAADAEAQFKKEIGL